MNIVFRVARQMYNYNMDACYVAVALGMTCTTVSVQLKKHGTNFSTLLTAVRWRMAQRLIKQGKTAECISHELGYSTIQQFYRAFQSWAGMSFNDYLEYQKCNRHLENLGLLGNG